MYDNDQLTNEMIILMLQKNMEDGYLFSLLIERFMPIIRKFAYHVEIDGYEPQDIINEAVLLMYRVMKGFDPTYGVYFAAYFERAYYNYLCRLARDNKKHADTLRIGFQDEHNFYPIGESLAHQKLCGNNEYCDTPEEILIVQEEQEDYLNSLSKLERKVIYHYSKLGLKPSEIAKELKIEPKTVKYALRRAKDKLKAQMKNQE